MPHRKEKRPAADDAAAGAPSRRIEELIEASRVLRRKADAVRDEMRELAARVEAMRVENELKRAEFEKPGE